MTKYDSMFDAIQNNSYQTTKKKKKNYDEQFSDIQNNSYELIAPIKSNQEPEEEKFSIGNEILKRLPVYSQYYYGKKAIDKIKGINPEDIVNTSQFDDGYQFGDVTKTTAGTIVNGATAFTKGVMGIGDSAAKLVTGGAAQVFDWAGNEEFANALRKAISDNSPEAVEEKKKYTPYGWVEQLNEKTDDYSILGETPQQALEGAGYYAGMTALQEVGIPWYVTAAASSMGNELGEAYSNDAEDWEAWASAINSAAWEVVSEKLAGGVKLPGTGKTTEALFGSAVDQIKNKTLKALVGFGINMAGEGAEEVISGITSEMGRRLTYMRDDEKSLIENALNGATDYMSQQALDDFIMGAVVSGLTMGVNPQTYRNAKAGRNLITGYTSNEQRVLDKVTDDRIAEAQKNSKKPLTKKQLNQISSEVKADFESGNIGTKNIENVLGYGEVYLQLKNQTEDSIGRELTPEEDRAVLQEATEIYNESIKDDAIIQQNYYEDSLRSQVFEANLEDYDEELRETIQKAIDSGILNNSTKTHQFVEFLSNLARDKGVTFDFTNNEALANSGIGINGAQVNGYVNANGDITLNIESGKSLNSVVGHELTHVLEGSDLYKALSDSIKEYATTIGEYQDRYDKLAELYKDVKNANIEKELTADLVGDYLFTNQEFINHLTSNRNLFEKIYDEIKYLVKQALPGSKEEKQLRKVQKMFEQAYKDNSVKLAEQQNATNDVKLSISGLKGVNNLDDSKFKRGAINNYNEAIQMKKDGSSNEEIRQKTKWFQDKNGHWKYELDDKNISLNMNILKENGEYKLGELLDFPMLYRLYPKFEDYKVKFKDMGEDKSGSYSNLTKTILVNNKFIKDSDYLDLKGTLLHEIQHAIQHYEGFEAGANSKLSGKAYMETLGEIEAADVKQRYVNKVDKQDIAPLSSLENPKHPNYDNYLKKRTKLDKVKDAAYPLYKGVIDYVKNIQKNNDENIGNNRTLVDGRVKYSLSTDSTGKELSKEQQEYFKDSKVRDDEGRLQPVYHMTNADFNKIDFDKNYQGVFWFASSKQDLQDGTVSAVGTRDKANSKIMELYANITNPAGWREYDNYGISQLKEMGYDGVILKEDDGSFVGFVFNDSNQIKNVDNTNPTDNSDIRYSLSTDSNGRELTEQQQEYFKDSKARDENGQLIPVYHGTTEEINVFDKNRLGKNTGAASAGEGFFFTDNKKIAEDYSRYARPQYIKDLENEYKRLEKEAQKTGNWDDYYRAYEKYEDAELTYAYNEDNQRTNAENQKEVYLNLTNPLIHDFKGMEYRDESYYDLLKQAKENGNDGAIFKNTYDGYGEKGTWENPMTNIYVAFESNQIKNVDNLNPTDNEDIRYSLSGDAIKDLSKITGESYSMLEANLGNDEYSVKNYLINHTNLVKNYMNNNNITVEPVMKSTELDKYSQEYKDFITNNDISIMKLGTNKELLNKYLDILRNDMLNKGTPENIVNAVMESQKESFDKVDENYDIPLSLRRYDNEFNLIKNDIQEIEDEYETEKKIKKEVVESDKFQKYLDKITKPLFKKEFHTTEEIMEEAENNHGITDNYETGAYMTTNGNLLDFNDGGYRDDHRTIDAFDLDMNEFMEAGAIRMKPEANGFEMAVEPTQEQYSKLYDYIDYCKKYNANRGSIDVDIDIPGTMNYDTAVYNIDTPTSKIINDIKTYYETGKFPEKSEYADFYYSLSKQNEDIAPIGNYNVYGSDIALQDEIAPIQDEFIKKDILDLIHQEVARKGGKKVELVKPVIAKEKTPVRTTFDTLVESFVNENVELDNMSRESGNKMIKIAGDMLNNAYSEAQYDITAAQTDNYGNAIGKSVQQLFELAKKEGLEAAFNDYLINYSNIDRWARGKGSQTPLDVSERLVANYEEKYPQFKVWAQDVWKYAENVRNNWLEAGMISQNMYKVLSEAYPHYVPYISDTNNFDATMDKMTELKARPIKKAKGGAAELFPVEEALTRYTYAQKRAYRQNELYKQIYNTLQTNPGQRGAEVGEDYFNGTEPNLYRDDSGNYLTAVIDGEERKIQISDDLYKSLSHTFNNQVKDLENRLSTVLKPLQWASNIRRKLLTTWNPVFLVKNVVKDLQDGILNSKHTTGMLKNYAPGIVELFTNSTPEAKQFKALYGTDALRGQYEEELYKPKEGNKNNGFLKGLVSANEIMELAPRYAEFKASLQAGESLEEAMYNAREITTNFARGGVITKALNRNGFTFLNASVQGFDKFIRNFSGENGAKGIANSLLKAAIFAVAPAVFNELAFGVGDDKDEEYDALPDYIKDNYYLIKIGDGTFVRIPKGRMLSVFGSAARRTIELAEGEENAFEGYLSNVNNQIGVNNPEENNIFSPLIQAYGSENGTAWYGGDIVPSRLQDKPKNEQYDASTDKFSIWLSNTALGKKMGLSPYKVNYVLDQYSGAIGDIALPMITDEATSNGNVLAPVVDQFVVDSTTDNKYVSEFYSKNDELKVKANSSEATDKDYLRNQYMYGVSKEMSKLYAERREIQSNNSLTKEEKYRKSQAIKEQINKLAKNGLEGYDDISVTGNYAHVGYDMGYYKNAKGNWTPIDQKDIIATESIGLTDREMSAYYGVKNDMYNIDQKYEPKLKTASDEEKTKLNAQKKVDIINSIKNTNLPDNAKAILYDKKYGSTETLNAVIDCKIDFDSYLDLQAQNFTADKDRNGKTINGSKKRKIYSYINQLDMPYEQKIMLAKLEYKSDDTYNREIINYLNNDKSINYQTMVEILEAMGFKIDENGNISWE